MPIFGGALCIGAGQTRGWGDAPIRQYCFDERYAHAQFGGDVAAKSYGHAERYAHIRLAPGVPTQGISGVLVAQW